MKQCTMKTTSISLLIILTALAFPLSTEAEVTGINDNQLFNRGCRIRAVNPLMHDIIRNKMEKERLNLIEYKLTFRNYSYNPMTTNVTRYHKADTWSRVFTSQGQILRSLAFNYRVLSLMTLTVGTNSTQLELEDIPNGCIGKLPEEQKVELVQQLLMRDFKEGGNASIVGEGRLCNIEITNQSGYAKFTDYCCSVDTHTLTKVCELNDANQWLRIMWIMLTVIRYGVLFFGPLLFLSIIAKMVNKKIPYAVKLGVPLQKKIMLSRLEPDTERFDVKRRVNLKNHNYSDFPKLMKSLCKRQLSIGSNREMIDEKPFRSFIYEYRIAVNYTRLLMEDEVPVGFWKLILKSVFFCELRDVGPFVDCCKQSICNKWPDFLWIKFWKTVGLCLIIFLLPMPYYLRLIIFYFFEQDEVMLRNEAVTRMGLKLSFENSIVQYLLPTHPLFLGIYAMYFAFALVFAFAMKIEENPFHKIFLRSFEDLRNLSLVGVLHILVSNIIWPFEEFGIYAIFIIFIYWPIVLPITCLVSVSYCIPTIYLTIRMLFHPMISIMDRIFKLNRVKNMARSQKLLETKTLWKLFHVSDKNGNNARTANDPENNKHSRNTLKSIIVLDSEVDRMRTDNKKITDQSSSSTTTTTITSTPNSTGNILVHTCTAIFCIAAMYSILIILSECIGCFVDIVVFTMMGIIVNAGALLRYVSLAVLLLVYAFDSFNNVEKKYLQLNKALFNAVKDRVKKKKLEEVTGQPSDIQKNTGFKSQELSEQGKHEQPDDIANGMSRYWFINDLILFVDKEDVPRIPKKLFDEVCHIKVAGVPGPVYLGVLSALKSFAKIAIFVTFVFLVILSFGGAYGLSSTTQTIAALAVGLGPRLMDTLVQPPKTDIDAKTVSFSNKLDEVVMNFNQFWPMKDFCFDMKKITEKEGSEGKDVPIVSTNPVVDSKEDVNEVKTDSSTDEDFLMLSKCDRTKAEQNDTYDRPEIEKMLRRDLKREEVDIVIILPEDVDEHWNDEWTKFITKENSKKNETTVQTNDSRETQLRENTTPRPRKTAKFTDDVIETERDGSGLVNEVAAASVQA